MRLRGRRAVVCSRARVYPRVSVGAADGIPGRTIPSLLLPESCETAAIGSATGRFAQFMSRTPLVNREIGWLSFNERVLQEAADPEVPLIERLKFVGICSSNLEEFF